ncbi:MAG TPA: ester cyclase [Alphaproteobacteria bacterium]|nr:ester cyclase [Alphaproteobacteria bacterium]
MDRRILASVSLAAALFAAPAIADEAANVRTVKDYVAAWNAHSVDEAAGYFAEGVVYYDASVGEPVEGKAAAATQVVANFINAAPDLNWEMLGDPVAQGDMVAFQWRFSGTNTGPWADGTEASGKPFLILGASFFSVRDRRIQTQSDYYDALGFFEQLGWIGDGKAVAAE